MLLPVFHDPLRQSRADALYSDKLLHRSGVHIHRRDGLLLPGIFLRGDLPGPVPGAPGPVKEHPHRKKHRQRQNGYFCFCQMNSVFHC